LALAALALQLAVSFGHVHAHGVHRGEAVGAVSRVQAPPAAPSLPDDDDYCAICASIYLTTNSFVPHAPQLPAPPASSTVVPAERTAAVCIASRRAPFQSRAPPLA